MRINNEMLSQKENGYVTSRIFQRIASNFISYEKGGRASRYHLDHHILKQLQKGQKIKVINVVFPRTARSSG